MDEIIAYCGLTCHTCPIFAATREPVAAIRNTMRESVAAVCREQYGMDVEADDINDCDGCTSGTGRLFFGCAKCEIRPCAQERKLESCAHCAEFACAKLEKIFASENGARTRLEAMRAIR
jgi:hypothetical protein